MADDPMDSDSYIGSKRRVTTDNEQEQETLLQLSSSLSEITRHQHHQDSTPQDRQEEATMDDSSPKKKAKCFSLLYEGNQELGLHSSTENAVLSGSFEKEKIDNVETKEGSFGVQEVDSQVNSNEVDKGEQLGTCLEFEEKRAIKGKALEFENVLEAEKKRLLGELEVGKLFGAKTCTGNVSGFAANSSKIDDDGNIGDVKGLDLPVRGSLKIEVIDDTALIGSFPLSKTGNGSVKNEKKNAKEEIDGKKVKRSRRKGKNAKNVLGEVVRHIKSANIVEVQNGRKESNTQSKIMYSRKELEALRFAKVVEQRKLWRDVYNGLGSNVIREYENLGSWKQQKNISLSSDTRQRLGRKAESPATTLREDYSKNMDNELECMEDNETENVYLLGLTSTHDVGVEDTFIDVEEECIEDDDCDEDYTSILKPAFMIEGEPDFDSGPPEDGLEYLRRVRWEAAQIPKIKIAKPDRIKLNKEQSVYMPQIPEIAKCPQLLLPLKQWEESFLADFSELRLTLSYVEDPGAEIYCKLPKFSVPQGDLCQLPESIVTENFNNLATGEVHSDQTTLANDADSVIILSHWNPCAKTYVTDTCGVVIEDFNNLATGEVHSDQTTLSNDADSVIIPSHQNPCAKTCVTDTCGVVTENFNNLATGEVHSDQRTLSNDADSVIIPSHQNPCAKTCVIDTCGDYPTLSAIRKMDSVARVSMLRKRISSIEPMASLSRSNCVWLFALCAAVDTPLDADTCASLRSLLRKCANLRAGKSEVDDEVVMLNILATISGRYFGQSET